MPWPCNDDQVHLALPRDPGDLVLRLRLRRQRAARQEVLRAADRLGHGPRRGLAGRAHAHPQGHPAGGRGQATSPRRSRRRAARPTWPCCEPTIPGWKVETIGDDIAWMRFGADGRLRAINPEAGFFGVAPGHQRAHQPQRDPDADPQHHLHQRRADRRRRRVVGRADRRAAGAPDRLARPGLDAGRRHARPRTRTPGSRWPPAQCPSIAPEWDDPAGVPISAILFGGRRATAVPLVTEAYSWQHGVFLGATIASENDRRGRGHRSASCAATRSPCCRSAATTWATTSATG